MKYDRSSIWFLCAALFFGGCRYSDFQGTQLVRPNFVSANHYGAVDGKAIGYDDLDNEARRKIHALKVSIFDQEKKALEERVTAELLEKEAKRRSVTVSELLNYEVFEPLAKKSTKDVAAFLAENKDQLEGMVREKAVGIVTDDVALENLTQAMPSVLQETLLRREGALMLAQYLEKLKQQANVQVFLYPPLPLRQKITYERAPHYGEVEAPVKVYGFMSYGDELSKTFHEMLKEEVKIQGGRLLYVWMHAPKPEDPFLKKVHGISACVFDIAPTVEQFWKFHEALLSQGSKLAEPDLEKSILKAGMKKEVLAECMRPIYQTAAQSVLKRDARIMTDLASPSGPVFYINGIEARGIAGEESFRSVLDHELKANYFVAVEKL